LVMREGRLDAVPGILVPVLSGYTERVQKQTASRDWSTLLEQFRTGPPTLSPYRLLDSLVNAMEFFVHHEDVRRTGDGWEPRALPSGQQDGLWLRLRLIARLGYRHSPVGVVLQREDGTSVTAKRGPHAVTLVGPPAELVLHASGRDAVRLEPLGAAADVDAVLSLDRSF
ncbi:MAG: TIGR03085 family metal-binding protein, partial [Mycobacteriaceae bacterium]